MEILELKELLIYIHKKTDRMWCNIKKLIGELIFNGTDPRTRAFKELLNKADVSNLTCSSVCDAMILPPYKQTEIYFILEYKLAYLMKNGTKHEIAHLNYVISNYLFLALTPIFGRDLAIKYAEDACLFNNNDEYTKWLEDIINERIIF